MLKRIIVVLAGLFLMLGLAAPASGQAAEQAQMTIYSDIEFTGTHDEVAVPGTGCTAIPVSFTVLSVENFNSSTNVEFFDSAGCSATASVGTVAGNDDNSELDAPATHYRATS